jgi:hypothetical protein
MKVHPAKEEMCIKVGGKDWFFGVKFDVLDLFSVKKIVKKVIFSRK